MSEESYSCDGCKLFFSKATVWREPVELGGKTYCIDCSGEIERREQEMQQAKAEAEARIRAEEEEEFLRDQEELERYEGGGKYDEY